VTKVTHLQYRHFRWMVHSWRPSLHGSLPFSSTSFKPLDRQHPFH